MTVDNEPPPPVWDSTISAELGAGWCDEALFKRSLMVGFITRRHTRLTALLALIDAEHARQRSAAINAYEQETDQCVGAVERLMDAVTARAIDYRAVTGKASIKTLGFGVLRIGKPGVRWQWPTTAEDERALINVLPEAYVRRTDVPATIKVTIDKNAIKQALIQACPPTGDTHPVVLNGITLLGVTVTGHDGFVTVDDEPTKPTEGDNV